MEQGEAPLMVQVEKTPAGWTLIDDIRGKPTGGRATHEGRRAALRRRTRPGPKTWRRKKDAPGRSRGGHPRSPVVRPDLRGDSSGELHLPLRSGEHMGSQVDGMTLAAVIGLVLFTIGAMEHPFSGGARIGTEAFDLVLERLETSRLSDI